jgi:hypothetical protein
MRTHFAPDYRYGAGGTDSLANGEIVSVPGRPPKLRVDQALLELALESNRNVRAGDN